MALTVDRMIRGGGLFCSNPNARPGFAGERHGIEFFNKEDRGCRYNYLGPGTALEQRLARQDPPLNELDKLAQTHDIQYNNAKKNLDNNQDRGLFRDSIASADRQFIEATKAVKGPKKTAAIARNLMRLKAAGEVSDVLATKRFSGAGVRLPNSEAKEQKRQEALESDPLLLLKEELGLKPMKGGSEDMEGILQKEILKAARLSPNEEVRNAAEQEGGFLSVLLPIVASVAGSVISSILSKK